MKSFTAWVLVTFGLLVIVAIFALPGCGDDCDPPPRGGGGGIVDSTEHHHGEGFPDPGHFHGPNGDSTHTHGQADPDGH